ncbi:hypothetical protein FOCC_FOCC001051 [Frankliniella occidentalis]|nr:hypothetical protein FOCC_FOCC001051 [Frankliniella occidentalis]
MSYLNSTIGNNYKEWLFLILPLEYCNFHGLQYGREIEHWEYGLNEMEESEERSRDMCPLVRDQALECKLSPFSFEDSYSWTDAQFQYLTVESQEENQPDCFKPFPNLRCVVDSTTICIQKPSDMAQQSNTWSTYKASNVIKFQIAISKYGGLSYISEGMEGSISDRKSILKSGILEYLNPGEALMCDRGYDIEADLNEIEVDLLIPPFLGDRKSFTEREILLAKAIATSRIHVETFIGRMKFFKLIRQVLPNNLIDVSSDIVRILSLYGIQKKKRKGEKSNVLFDRPLAMG